MRLLNRIPSTVAVVAVACTTALIPSTAALAADDSSPSSTVVLPPGVAQQSPEADHQIRDALEALVGKQSPEEIEALAAQPQTTILYDWETETDLAAVQVIPYSKNETKAITQIGPGCSTTSLCIQNGNPYGFTGTGIQNVNIPHVFKAYSGNLIASLTPDRGSIKVLAPNVTAQFQTPITVTKITRG